MLAPAFDRVGAAQVLRAARAEIGGTLARLVSTWPKYAAQYADDPDTFAEIETYALVEYMARLVETGDENFRHLYIGEKAKQFHDSSVEPEERRRRETALLKGEREIFAAALAADPKAAGFIQQSFDAIDHALSGVAKAQVKALFVGDCLYLDVISFLTAPALADGIRLVPSFITSHSAVEIRAQLAKLADERFDVIFYSPFTYALLSDYEALQRPRGLLRPAEVRKHVETAVADAIAIFDVMADLFDCPIVAHAPAPILRSEGTLRERIGAMLITPALRRATGSLADMMHERAAARSASGQVVYILDEAAVAAGSGGLRAAGRYLFKSGLQHPAMFGAMLAPLYRDIIMVAGRLLKRKVVACDLDNTLWQGVVGEGLGVVHHYDRQAPLLTLKARGVVLAINSKNDPAKATWEAEEGRLALDHFVSRQINWDPKVLNMRRIAEHLNLKEKDFVFIDDRADERAMVEEEIPTMLTLDALEPRSWRLLGLWADLLPQRTGADRTEFYRQRDERQKFIAVEAELTAHERTEMLKKLDLKLTVREAAERDLDRVADLINRTNQFNMTGGRTTKRQVQEFATRDDALVLIADASDRFGSMGTISVLIAERGGGRLTIPFFVLSCRVFGYGMEFALLKEVRRFARQGEALFGPFVETPFNQPCCNVYPTAGFRETEGGWQLDDPLSQSEGVPAWLTVQSEVRTSAHA